MKQFLTLLLCGCFTGGPKAYGQFSSHAGGTPFSGSAAYSSRQENPFSFTGNEASLARIIEPVAGIYCERTFMLPDDQLYNLAIVFPTSSGNFGVAVSRIGTNVFKQQMFDIAYAKKLGDRVDIGIQFSYSSTAAQGYKNVAQTTAGAGMLLHLSDKVIAGAEVKGFSFFKNKKGEKNIPSAAYSFGLGYDVSQQIFTCFQVIKQEDVPVNVLGNLCYQFAEKFFAGIGFLSATSSVNSSAGVRWKKLRVEVSLTSHPQLGFSPGLLMIFYFKNKM